MVLSDQPRVAGIGRVAGQASGGSCPAARVSRRATTCRAARASALPSRRQRPCTDSSVSPGDARRSAPPSCSVFHGVPRPASHAAGHWPSQPRRGRQRDADSGRSRAQAQQRALPFRQHGLRAAAARAAPARRPQLPFEPAGQRARVAAAGAAGQHRHGAAVPDRAARVGQQQRPPVAAATAPASQAAGANAISAGSAPSSAPAIAQRTRRARATLPGQLGIASIRPSAAAADRRCGRDRAARRGACSQARRSWRCRSCARPEVSTTVPV